jgi:hypothetical protein
VLLSYFQLVMNKPDVTVTFLAEHNLALFASTREFEEGLNAEGSKTRWCTILFTPAVIEPIPDKHPYLQHQ